MKNIVALALLACSSLYGVAGCIDLIDFRGDVDGSGSLNLSDAIYLTNYLTDGGPDLINCLETGDVNTDGQVDISDPVFLLNYLFDGGTAPYPETVTCHIEVP